jgi:hypothetical protein
MTAPPNYVRTHTNVPIILFAEKDQIEIIENDYYAALSLHAIGLCDPSFLVVTRSNPIWRFASVLCWFRPMSGNLVGAKQAACRRANWA